MTCAHSAHTTRAKRTRLSSVVSVVVLFVSVYLVAGCEGPGERLDLPDGQWRSLLWHTDGYIYVDRILVENSDTTAPSEIWRVRPGGEAEWVPLPEGCPEARERNLRSMPDGRLAPGWVCDDGRREVALWDNRHRQGDAFGRGSYRCHARLCHGDGVCGARW